MPARRLEHYHKCEVCGTIVQMLDREEKAWKNGKTSYCRWVLLDISSGRQIVTSDGGIICISFWGKRAVDELEKFHVGQMVKAKFEPVCYVKNRADGKPKVIVYLKGFKIKDAISARMRKAMLREAEEETTNE